LLVGPETAIPEGVWEDKLDESPSIDSLKNFQLKYPKLNILIGLSSYKIYKKVKLYQLQQGFIHPLLSIKILYGRMIIIQG